MDTIKKLININQNAKTYRLAICKRVAILYLYLSKNFYDFASLSQFCEQIASQQKQTLMNILAIGLSELDLDAEQDLKTQEHLANASADNSMANQLRLKFSHIILSGLELNLKYLKAPFVARKNSFTATEIIAPPSLDQLNISGMIKLFHNKLGVSLNWLKHGRGGPFLNIRKHLHYPEDILKDPLLLREEKLHLILTHDQERSLFIIRQLSKHQYTQYNKIWHLSDENLGITNEKELISLYVLLKKIGLDKFNSYIVEGDIFKQIYYGEIHFGTLNLERNYWADDLIDLDSIHTHSYDPWLTNARKMIMGHFNVDKD